VTLVSDMLVHQCSRNPVSSFFLSTDAVSYETGTFPMIRLPALPSSAGILLTRSLRPDWTTRKRGIDEPSLPRQGRRMRLHRQRLARVPLLERPEFRLASISRGGSAQMRPVVSRSFRRWPSPGESIVRAVGREGEAGPLNPGAVPRSGFEERAPIPRNRSWRAKLPTAGILEATTPDSSPRRSA
jgi:hypothetical protein